VLLNAMRLLWFERAADSPGWRQTRATVQRVDRWMERNLSADEVLHQLGHHWRPVVLGLLALAVSAYGLSGLTQVNADEQAVVRHLGRPLPELLGPGLHWRW